MKSVLLFTLAMGFSYLVNAQNSVYPDIIDDQLVLQGDQYGWDRDAVHTLSVVEANKDGYRYWGYYGLDHYENPVITRKSGIIRSNDLINWEKYEYNPIIASNCRWPTVVMHDGIFYMFYSEYKGPNNDSRIVMVESTNGVDFDNKKVIVPYSDGQQNQNPFIYLNPKDKTFYLYYYNGTEQNPEIDKRYWSIRVKKSVDLDKLDKTSSVELLKTGSTLAAPSVAYYNNTYYLLVEELIDNKWVTNAFYSGSPDKGFKQVKNNPILANNDACAFQYVINNKLYVTYSHNLSLAEGKWVMRIFQAK